MCGVCPAKPGERLHLVSSFVVGRDYYHNGADQVINEIEAWGRFESSRNTNKNACKRFAYFMRERERERENVWVLRAR